MESAGLGSSEEFLAEVGLQRAEALVHRLQLRLLCWRQLGARMLELLVLDIEQFRLLGIEVQLRLMIVQILHAGEQLRVQIDEVVVRSEQWRSLGVGRLQRVVGVGAVDCRESEVRALEHLARPLERRQRVVEGRRRGVVGDRQHFALLLRHSGE